MATQGSFVLFQGGLNHLQNDVKLLINDIRAVLCTSSQALSNTFLGTSGDCRYSDLTAELATANGYTAGGIALTTKTITTVSGFSVFSSDPMAWTLTGAGVTFKYLVLYDNTVTNKNLLCFCDMDTGGGSVSPVAGALQVTPNANGIFRSS